MLATTLFTGASIYINIAEHPARLECGTALAATVFVPSYRRAAVMQVILAVLATAGAITAWADGGSASWLLAALLIFAVIPFTFFAIMPTNKILLDPGLDRSSETAGVQLRRWGRLHAVRSGLSLASSILAIASMHA